MRQTIFTGAVAALLLTAAQLPELSASTSRADVTRARLRNVRETLSLYRARYGSWPQSLEQLAEPKVGLLPEGGGRVRDAWDRPLVWLRPGRTDSSGCLLSKGADGVLGTKDDLTDICDLAVLNQHLLLAAGFDVATHFPGGLRDAYGASIRLIEREGHWLAWSYGPDGEPDTEDDVMARVRKH